MPPLPLSLGIAALAQAKRFHVTPPAQRPWMLRRLYYARLVAYAGVGVVVTSGALFDEV